jgi:hypothetical protein
MTKGSGATRREGCYPMGGKRAAEPADRATFIE